jgi:cystathionine beta-lyase/cystathionine gamma-synthase
MNETTRNNLATEAIHSGEKVSDISSEAGDVVSPIHLATHHEMHSPGSSEHGYKYSRFGNPTRDALETRLARLSGADYATAFSSGTAAIATAGLTHSEPEGHIVAFDGIYGGTRLLFEDLFREQLGIEIDYVDATNPASVDAAIRPETNLIWMETPTNPLLKLCDLDAIANIADDHGVPMGVDNTFATPYFQRPLELGADFVVHSTTKYLNGHSDSTGGVVATNDTAITERVSELQEYSLGNLLAPFDSYLILRGTKTLPLRMRKHAANAQSVAEFLAGHSAVVDVNYPGLESHPQHELAERQMSDFGGIVSFELDASEAETKAVLEQLDIFTIAVSLGGVESLVDHPWSMSASFISPEERRVAGISESLVRTPIGIESKNDLIRDLKQALAHLD